MAGRNKGWLGGEKSGSSWLAGVGVGRDQMEVVTGWVTVQAKKWGWMFVLVCCNVHTQKVEC